jgi:DNA-binding NarL/FixJ family response regulator
MKPASIAVAQRIATRKDRREADMDEVAAACLIFAPDGVKGVETVARLLRHQGMRTVRSACLKDCLDLLVRDHWRLLVIDTNGDAETSLRLLAESRRARADVGVLVLVKEAGAADCIEKPVRVDHLAAATARVCTRAASPPGGPPPRLTRAERTVLQYLLDGRTSRETATALSRSPRTVEVHRCRIMEKLGAANVADLVRRAMEARLVEREDTGLSAS